MGATQRNGGPDNAETRRESVYKLWNHCRLSLFKPGEADRIVAGHPWVYHGSILRLTAQAGDGELVQVKDHRQRLLGMGFYNSKSEINVRVLAPERVEVDQSFFEERIRAALAVRQAASAGGHLVPRGQRRERFPQRPDRGQIRGRARGPDFRARHGAAEGEDRGRAAKDLFAARHRRTQRRGLAQVRGHGRSQRRHLRGELGGPVTVESNGLKFETDLLGGHKTGHVSGSAGELPAVAQFAKGAQVLDCFSFLGGFGLHAARAGAAQVHLLDQSAEAIAAATRNAAGQRPGGTVLRFETVNVFDWLKAQTAVKPPTKKSSRVSI